MKRDLYNVAVWQELMVLIRHMMKMVEEMVLVLVLLERR